MPDVIDPPSYQRLKKLVYDLAGIDLKPGKEALVSGRLQKRMRDLGLPTYKAYLDTVEAHPDGDEIVLLLDAISTNVTSFFREAEHFALLRKETATWLAEGRTKLRVWCAASSSGEEPYTIAMTMLSVIGKRPVDLKILATDISTRVLEMARRGVYPATAVANVPPELRAAYIVPEADPNLVRMCPEVRNLITFNRLNLAKPPYTIAMTMLSVIGKRPVDLKILATDISTRVLEMARRGVYPATAVASVPADLRAAYMAPEADPNLVRMRPEVRNLITFNRLNLAKPPYPMAGPFDAVFCRNVMIYFDNEVRSRIVGQVRRITRSGGIFCVGHAESLSTLQGDLKTVQAAAYRIP